MRIRSFAFVDETERRDLWCSILDESETSSQKIRIFKRTHVVEVGVDLLPSSVRKFL